MLSYGSYLTMRIARSQSRYAIRAGACADTVNRAIEQELPSS
jgi:hypothetical protein